MKTVSPEKAVVGAGLKNPRKRRYCKPGSPCLTHDRRPRTLAQNRVIFGPSFGYEPTQADHQEAAFPW